jgi:hypothetical protein
MQTKEKNFKNLFEFIKTKKFYYLERWDNSTTNDVKILHFYECLYILLTDIEIEFKKEETQNNNQ